VVLSHAHAAQHDLDAIGEAERRSSTHTIEVWDGERVIARLRKRNMPLRPRPERTRFVGK
jgi:hypothetical protein